MDKGAKNKLARSPGENGGGQDAQKDLNPRTGRDETAGKTQERMERECRRRFSSAGSEKMDRADDWQEKMEGRSSAGQSPQQSVVPMEEEEEEEFICDITFLSSASCSRGCISTYIRQ
jgi:hypothetical protein